MIPSTSKLVLLFMMVQLADITISSPVYHDYRQKAESNNVFVGFDDTEVVVVPSKEMEDIVLVMAPLLEPIASSWLSGKRAKTSKNPPELIKSQYGFIRPEKSPYKVDLEASRTPLVKVDAMAPQTISKREDSEVKPEESAGTGFIEEVVASHEEATTGSHKEKKEMKEPAEVLTLVQEGLEECGPDGHRDETGVCIFSPVQ